MRIQAPSSSAKIIAVPASNPLLAPAPPEILRPEGRGGVLILCDHASNHVPPALGNLGLAPETLTRHIAYDIGAATVTQRLSALLDAPAILATVSRLVIDLNRAPGARDAIPDRSDGVVIPGNQGLDAAARRARIDAVFVPYHAACERQLAAMRARGERPIVIGLHSFTPEMNGTPRPWPIGFLYDRDPRLFAALRAPLKADYGFDVGDNEPYSGRELYYTMHRHGEAHGLMQATIEIRQDQIADVAGQRRWAAIFADCLQRVLARDGERSGLRTD